jgi:hypothetical protein
MFYAKNTDIYNSKGLLIILLFFFNCDLKPPMKIGMNIPKINKLSIIVLKKAIMGINMLKYRMEKFS